MPAIKSAKPRTERTPRPPARPVDLAALAAAGHEVWTREITTFDHPHVHAQALVVIHRDAAKVPWKTAANLFDGVISKSKPRDLDLSNGRLIESYEDEEAALVQRGYARWSPPAPPVSEPAPKKKRGRPRKTN